ARSAVRDQPAQDCDPQGRLAHAVVAAEEQPQPLVGAEVRVARAERERLLQRGRERRVAGVETLERAVLVARGNPAARGRIGSARTPRRRLARAALRVLAAL